jgi:hypothetical protein
MRCMKERKKLGVPLARTDGLSRFQVFSKIARIGRGQGGSRGGSLTTMARTKFDFADQMPRDSN